MKIQGKASKIINVLDKNYMTFINKNKGVVDIREVLGKVNGEFLYADYRPQRVVLNPDSVKPTVVDLYHKIYGQNLKLW